MLNASLCYIQSNIILLNNYWFCAPGHISDMCSRMSASQMTWKTRTESCIVSMSHLLRNDTQDAHSLWICFRNVTDWSIMADFLSLKHCIVAQIWWVQLKFCKTLVTRYSFPNHKVSNQFKSYNGFWLYPPLWTSHLVAMHDDIGNRSIGFKIETIALPTFNTDSLPLFRFWHIGCSDLCQMFDAICALRLKIWFFSAVQLSSNFRWKFRY